MFPVLAGLTDLQHDLAFTEAQKVFPYIGISVEKTYSIHII